MHGKLHPTPPPGYLTASQAAEALGMSRANFHATGLAGALDRWQAGGRKSPALYRADDVAHLARWLVVRRGLIALGALGGNVRLAPDDAQWAGVLRGDYDEDCPGCGGDGVGVAGRVWCPVHGVVNQ